MTKEEIRKEARQYLAEFDYETLRDVLSEETHESAFVREKDTRRSGVWH